mmetsp:Transcript_21653/g.60108  ORF Transcript_21653/g.60108 Transcript_21653/m.60108 type:complete len:225 (+) Transcript_21653:781-1455(+)
MLRATTSPEEGNTFCFLQLANNRHVGSEIFVHNQSQDTHLRCTAIVQFDGSLLQLFFIAEGVPSKIDPAIAVVTSKLIACSFNVAHETLQKGHGGKNIGCQASGHNLKGFEARRNVGVGNSFKGSGKMNASTGDNLAQHGQHGNSAVDNLNFAKEFKLGFIAFHHDAQRVPVSQWDLCTHFIGKLRCRQGNRGGSLVGGGGKGGGRGEEGGKNSSLLHGLSVWN